jgi:hypothetical protein
MINTKITFQKLVKWIWQQGCSKKIQDFEKNTLKLHNLFFSDSRPKEWCR